jgi:hypothetical protein
MSALDRRSILFWTWVLFSVSVLYFLFAGGTLGYTFWWIDKYRQATISLLYGDLLSNTI